MARTNGFWEIIGSYIKTIAENGYNILINGTNKYINFNTISGSNGYGFRDNSGDVEVKSNGGSWGKINITTGIEWVTANATASNWWYSSVYGNGKHVAVSWNGSGDQVMTSTDGKIWKQVLGVPVGNWMDICYGAGLFVVIDGNNSDRIMTSPDGENWTLRKGASAGYWRSIVFGNGIFVAVGKAGIVQTSYDGIIWTLRTASALNNWYDVCFGNGLFVAVAGSGVGNRVMTSTDGINWTSKTTPADLTWYGSNYGNGQFIAVSWDDTGSNVMTSPDGDNWTLKNTPSGYWLSVIYGEGIWVAVSYGGANKIMTSPDGDNWTVRSEPVNNVWESISYGNNVFSIVGDNPVIATSGNQAFNEIFEIDTFLREQFETISQNIKSWKATLTVETSGTTKRPKTVVYTYGLSTITKTYNYDATLNRIDTIVLSGDLPDNIKTIKTYSYTGDSLIPDYSSYS